MNRRTKMFLQRSFYFFHRFMSRRGVIVLPAHYYSCVPEIRELERTQHLWRKRSEMPGVNCDVDDQVAALRRICAPYQNEYAGNKTYVQATAAGSGPGYGYVEAQALHGFIRHHKPRRVVEVGSGVSTRCSLAALELNRRETGQLASMTCIVPFPFRWLRDTTEVTLVPTRVQEVAMEVFVRLGENDLLFIDSSHMVKPGSDVNFLVLEVLPRLRPGVLVHVHDIFFPFDYPKDLMRTFLYAGGENSLLRAFLINNAQARIIFAMSMLHYDRPEVLKEIFPEYQRQGGDDGLYEAHYRPFDVPPGHFPSSLYMQIH